MEKERKIDDDVSKRDIKGTFTRERERERSRGLFRKRDKGVWSEETKVRVCLWVCG